MTLIFISSLGSSLLREFHQVTPSSMDLGIGYLSLLKIRFSLTPIAEWAPILTRTLKLESSN